MGVPGGERAFPWLRGSVSDFNILIDVLGLVSYSALRTRTTHFLLHFDYWLRHGPNIQDSGSESIT